MLNLLNGAPRLRTIHDFLDGIGADPKTGIPQERASRRAFEMRNGTYGAGDLVYGAVHLRQPSTPAPILDSLFGAVALTLRPEALARSTFYAIDSGLTSQYPFPASQLATVVTERLVRDAQLAGGPNLNNDKPPEFQKFGVRRALQTGDAAGIREYLASPAFGTGFRYIEAQIPRVTLVDVTRIDIGPRTTPSEQAQILERARERGIPVAASTTS